MDHFWFNIELSHEILQFVSYLSFWDVIVIIFFVSGKFIVLKWSCSLDQILYDLVGLFLKEFVFFFVLFLLFLTEMSE